MVGMQGSGVDGVGKDVLNCFPDFGCYRCDILQEVESSCLRHDVMMTRPCLKWLTAMNDICDLRKCDEQQPRKTMLAREKFAKLVEMEERMDQKGVS